MANRMCPHCEGKEDRNHDCKCKSWVVHVVEKDDPDDKGILIVVDGEGERKEVEFDDFGILKAIPEVSEDPLTK